MIYINYIYLISSLIPLQLRNAGLIAFLNACITPVATLHNKFQQYFQSKKWELKWNGQVCMLEELLNQVFNPSELPFRIYISDGDILGGTYVFKTSEEIGIEEETHVWLSTSETDVNENILYNDTWLFQANEQEEHFIIHVPENLTFNEDQFKALVDKYKLPTKKYKIVYE